MLELLFVSMLNFSGLKSSKLIIFEGVVHNVLSISNSLLDLLYITFFKELGCRRPYIQLIFINTERNSVIVFKGKSVSELNLNLL